MRVAMLMTMVLAGCPEPVDTAIEPPVALPLQVVTPDAIEFGDVEMGRAASPRQVTISNPGAAPLDVYEIYVIAEDEPLGFSIGSVGGGQRIRAGGQGSFIVELIPNSLGAASGTVVIESNVTPPGEGFQLEVSANAVKADPAFTPDAIEVVDPSQSARLPIEIRNLGAATLRVTGASVTGSAAFGVDLDPSTNGSLPYEIETADETSGRPFRTIYVTYDAELAEGGDRAELSIGTNEWLEPESVIVLTAAE